MGAFTTFVDDPPPHFHGVKLVFLMQILAHCQIFGPSRGKDFSAKLSITKSKKSTLSQIRRHPLVIFSNGPKRHTWGPILGVSDPGGTPFSKSKPTYALFFETHPPTNSPPEGGKSTHRPSHPKPTQIHKIGQKNSAFFLYMLPLAGKEPQLTHPLSKTHPQGGGSHRC